MAGMPLALPKSMQILHRFRLLRMASPSCIPQNRRGSRHLSRGLPGYCALFSDPWCTLPAPETPCSSPPLPSATKHSPPLPLSPDAVTKTSRARRSGSGCLPPSPKATRKSAPLRPSAVPQGLNLHHLPAPHLRFRDQSAINLIHPRQTLLDRR
jgi:hypothetical protein